MPHASVSENTRIPPGFSCGPEWEPMKACMLLWGRDENSLRHHKRNGRNCSRGAMRDATSGKNRPDHSNRSCQQLDIFTRIQAQGSIEKCLVYADP